MSKWSSVVISDHARGVQACIDRRCSTPGAVSLSSRDSPAASKAPPQEIHITIDNPN
jgi:hypothetical protein